MAAFPRQRLLARLLILALATTLSIALAEVAMRVLRPQQTYNVLSAMVGSQYQASEFNPFTLKAGYEGTAPSMEYLGTSVGVRTNSVGLRSPEVTLAKPEDTKRVLILGDSYTFGVYVENHETYSAVLEKQLRARGHQVEVLNAGYANGWETDHQYCWMANRGLQFEPDVIILGFFTGNDIMNLRPDLWAERDERGLPTKIVDPTIYVDEVGRLRKTRRYSLEEINNITAVPRTVGDQRIYRIPLLRNSHFFVALGSRLEEALRRATNYQVGPGAQPTWYPHIFWEKDSPDAPDGPWRFDDQEQIFLKLVQGLSQMADENGAELLVLMIPFNYQVEEVFLLSEFPEFRGEILSGRLRVRRDYFSELKPRLDEMGIESLNLLERMRRRPGLYYPRNGEVHFNPNGHAFVAGEILGELERLGWVP